MWCPLDDESDAPSGLAGRSHREVRRRLARRLPGHRDAGRREDDIRADAGARLAARVVDRVVVVAPTDHLRTQWADAADRMGIVLDPGLTNAVGPVRAGAHGYVTTYAQVAGKPMLHAAATEAEGRWSSSTRCTTPVTACPGARRPRRRSSRRAAGSA